MTKRSRSSETERPDPSGEAAGSSPAAITIETADLVRRPDGSLGPSISHTFPAKRLGRPTSIKDMRAYKAAKQREYRQRWKARIAQDE